ncbi:unnamed protein product [Ectocarpus fasciculatus]
MDPQGTDADTIRQKIEALVAEKDFRASVVQCEELEILTASTPFGKQHQDAANVHLALLLALDDVNNGRHLWRRLPASAKAAGGETAALWEVGKCLWKRDMSGAQAALRGREWSAPLAPYVALIETRVRERQLTVISKAFTVLPLESVAGMLACSVEDAEKACLKEGWEVGTTAEKTVKPAARVIPDDAIPAATPDYLQKMASHIAFLERQSQG